MLAIAGGKGGCGKTTTALGLASAFARSGLEPLVVDADSDMPDIHHRAAVSREPGVDALASGAGLRETVQHSEACPGVTVLAAGRRRHLGPALQAVDRWRGPVLVDCAAGANPDSVLPLRYADSAVVVSTDQPQGLEDAVDTVSAARQLDVTVRSTIIRETDGQSRPRVPPHLPEPIRIPSVEEPLSEEQIRTLWVKLSETIID